MTWRLDLRHELWNRLRVSAFAAAWLMAVGFLVATPALAQNLTMDVHFGGAQGAFEGKSDLTRPARFRDTDTDGDRTIVGGGAMGFRFPLTWALDRNLPRSIPDIHFRTELDVQAGREFGFSTESFRDGFELATDVEVLSFMSNWLAEVPFYREWSFVGGVGLGVAMVEYDVNVPTFLVGSKDKLPFAWSAQAGIEYRFDPVVSLGFGYRYVNLGEIRIPIKEPNPTQDAGNFDVDLASHEFGLHLRLDFYSF
jgi:opacity protein-like surface antigen